MTLNAFAKANRITPSLALALAPVLLDFPVGRFTAQVSYPRLIQNLPKTSKPRLTQIYPDLLNTFALDSAPFEMFRGKFLVLIARCQVMS